ncbi:MAG: hypothetical protein L6R41_005634 [Letrouitia leprolyta]|nr:MAG: hypothetical protein L6R41_005634 [Letrouitia leprolyta]
MADQTLNIPSLVVAAVIVFFSVRYFFFSSPSSTQAASDRNTANPAHIEHLAQMFPQLSRRDIQWDLQRNGGSVQATTERVLSGRGLERVCLSIYFPHPGSTSGIKFYTPATSPARTLSNPKASSANQSLHIQPPPSFQPIQPPSTSSSTTPAAPPPPKNSHPDLITRYKLESRLSQSNLSRTEEEEKEADKPKLPEWGKTKAERQALLQKRKDEMVLAARRRFEEKERERERVGK